MVLDMAATDAQIQELANAIAQQAEALANGAVDASAVFAHVRRIADNADTLKAWTEHLKPLPVSQGHRGAIDLDAINARPRPVGEFCTYCGLPGGHTRNCGRP